MPLAPHRGQASGSPCALHHNDGAAPAARVRDAVTSNAVSCSYRGFKAAPNAAPDGRAWQSETQTRLGPGQMRLGGRSAMHAPPTLRRHLAHNGTNGVDARWCSHGVCGARVPHRSRAAPCTAVDELPSQTKQQLNGSTHKAYTNTAACAHARKPSPRRSALQYRLHGRVRHTNSGSPLATCVANPNTSKSAACEADVQHNAAQLCNKARDNVRRLQQRMPLM